MHISLFLDNLSQKGFKLEIIGDRLSVSSPKNICLTEEEKRYIRNNQENIINYLSRNDTIALISEKIENSNVAPLSFSQQRLWFIDKLYDDKGGTYNAPVAFKIKGKLEIDLLENAFNQVVKAHNILRTTFKQDADGHVFQEILPYNAKAKIKIKEAQIEASDVKRRLLLESLQKFDLSTDMLIRVYLYNIKNSPEQILLVNQHHIICDAWSLNLFFNEVGSIYNSLKSGKEIEIVPPEIQFTDYIFWEKEHLQHKNMVSQIEYWKDILKGYTDLNLVSVESRPKLKTNVGSSINFQITEKTLNNLKKFSKKFNCTSHMILLSAFYTLLYRYSGQHDIVIGVPYANRNNLQVENILGFFVNMLPIRINIKDPSVEELFKYVKMRCIESHQNQNIPFEYIVEQLKIKRENSRTPVFQVAFAHYNVTENFNLDGTIVEKVYFDRGTAKYDLNLTLEMNNNELMGELEFNTSLFKDKQAHRIVETYVTVLEEIFQNHESKLSTLKLLPRSAYHKVIRNNNCENHSFKNKTMSQLFEDQVEKTPDRVAIVFGDQQLTYRELNEQSNQLALLIRSKNSEIYKNDIGANVYIGLYVERSLETIISIIAVLKSGAAYVPLDTNTPLERLEFQIQDSNCSIILTESNMSSKLPIHLENKCLLLCLDKMRDELARYSKNNLECINTATAPIYIIYTSGSTGRPKGVLQLHYNISRLFSTCEKYFKFTDKDIWVLFHSYSFDFSVWEMWGALLNGGKLIIPTFTETRNLSVFHKLLSLHKVTVLNQTPTAFYELAKIDINSDIKLSALKYIIFGGEILKIPLLKGWVDKYGLEKPQLVNMYGITEITIHATYKRISNNELNKQISNIGKPLEDLTTYILDSDLNPLPIGIPGELYIGGNGLAMSYVNLPELTRERFINNPFSTDDDKRHNFNLKLYKTGDIVRLLEDGDLEYLGRNDNQVQLRGFRIELEEIESKLLSYEGVYNAVAVCKERLLDARNEDSVNKYLCAYYTINKECEVAQKITNTSLREYLRQLLPDFMIPSYFVQLDEFPVTTNGKLDKNALPEPDFAEMWISANYIPAHNDLEQQFCNIWQDVLGVKKVGINSNFFEIGGNSILLTRLVAKIKKEVNIDLSLLDVFTYPNIKSLVDYLTDCKKTDSLRAKQQEIAGKDDIAVIGYSGAFSGCSSSEELWDKIFNGIDCITRLSLDEAEKMGVKPDLLKQKGHVRATGLVSDIDKFDAAFFGISPSDARFLDPQTRLFIEHSWSALELAGYIRKREAMSIAVFAGAGKPTYLYDNLKGSSIVKEGLYDWELDTLADPRRIATLTSFYLNLNGPSLFVDTACSTSMIAIIEAVMHLQAGIGEIALAGACSLYFPENFGYQYKNSMVGSPNGICAPFSQEASGIVPGSGVGVVVLKRLNDAVRDKDTIHAVIKGYGINNDGNRKVGYVAPSVQGQRECILSALTSANVTPGSISYIECHGTGTKLGDSIEISALKEIYGEKNARNVKQFLGSIKANIGHTDTAAGIASFIKVCKMFENKKIPPQINCEVINEQINETSNIFDIANQAQVWEVGKYPRRAGITSLGIGGTNAHIILEEGIENSLRANLASPQIPCLFSISAKSAYSLEQARINYIEFLKNNDSINLQNVAYTLHTAREEFSHRFSFAAKDYNSALNSLECTKVENCDTFRDGSIVDPEKNVIVVFVYSMLGAQCFNLSSELYQIFPFYKEEIDKCSVTIKSHLNEDFTDIIKQTEYAEVAYFIVGYCLTKLLISLDIAPTYIVGLGRGEYVAACISGLMRVEDAIYLMLARSDVFFQRRTNYGNNSGQIPQDGDQLQDIFSEIKLNPVKIPFLSSTTGQIISENDLLTIDYLHQLGCFSKNIENNVQHLALLDNATFINIGLDTSLITMIKQRQIDNNFSKNKCISILNEQKSVADYEYFISCIGKLWLQGIKIKWDQFYEVRDCRRLKLPVYSFDKKSFWVNSEIHSSGEPVFKLNQQVNENDNVNELAQFDLLLNELSSFWKKVFEIKEIDANVNFFDLGGNSVTAIRLMQLISDHFNIEVSINTLFEHPTISSLSTALSKYLFEDAQLNVKNQNLKQNTGMLTDNQTSLYAMSNDVKMLWNEVFMASDINIDANFFELGGNSIIAIRLVQLISDHFNAEISINILFENPTIASLSAVLSKNLVKVDSVFKPIVPDIKNAYSPFPLTDIQRAYVLGRQNIYDLGNIATHAYIERDYYDLDILKLESTFNQLIRRHSMLRVVFDVDSFSQRILEDVPYYKIQIQHLDAVDEDTQNRSLSDWRTQMSHQVLDITAWPIFDIRCSVLPNRIKLHLSFEVLVLDGQSLNILMAEWTKLYNNMALSVTALDCSFRDCVINYQKLKETNRYLRDKEYWLQRIKNFPSRPNLPLRSQPEQINSPTFKRCTRYIDMNVWNKFKSKCDSFNPSITPTAALALIYGIVLSRWSQSNHFAINMTFFNRLPLHNNIDNIVGDFTSLELLEFNLHELNTYSFIQKVSRLQSLLYTDLDHVLFSGLEVQRELNMISGNYKSVSYPIVFTSLLSLNMQGGAFLSDRLIDDTSNDITQTSQVWLDNKAYVLKQGFVAEWDYVEELFPEGVIEDMHECYCNLIDYYACSDWNEISMPELLNKNTLTLINSVNSETKKFPENLLHDMFFINAQTKPDKIAVVSSTGNLTYKDLATKSKQIANCLNRRGCGPNMLVAIILKKGWEQLVACYGILLAGAAYLPIDPDWPLARIIDVLKQGQVSYIMTHNNLINTFSDSLALNYTCLCIDDKSYWESYSPEQLPRQQAIDDLAYVIFTSGSTGKPKGAAITHRNATNTILDINDRFNISQEDVCLALSNMSFDLSVYDMFGLLSAGGTIVLPTSDQTRDPSSWIPLIIDRRVTIWNSVPMYMRMLVEYAREMSSSYLSKLKNSLRVVMLSGDWIPLELPNEIKSLFENVDVNSVGGPTECSIWSITYNINNVDPTWASIPYGKALANQKIYILNEDLEYCPVDVMGNIYIGGAGVGKFYWNDDKLTSKKFIFHPKFCERIFRTGDLGKLRRDGNVEILGREDHQIKISGYRVEIGEIKKAIKDIDGVDDVVITASGEKLKDKKLIAYVLWKNKKSEIPEADMLKFKQTHYNLRKNDFLGDKIKLDLPVMNKGLISSYFKRKSYRHFSQAMIDSSTIRKIFNLNRSFVIEGKASQNLSLLGRLSLLLQDMYAFQDKKLVLPKYRYPSAGSLYPVNIYITLNLFDGGNDNGSYYYNPHEHILYKVSEFSGFSDYEVTINFMSNSDAITPLYGEWSETFCQLECGYISEILENAGNKLGVKPIKIEVQTDVAAYLKCQVNSKYHYTLGINFSETVEEDSRIDLSKYFKMYVYIKPNRVINFDGGIYQWQNNELKYAASWEPNDEYLNQIGALGSTMRSSALIVFFAGEKCLNNNYYVGKISQRLINGAIGQDIGSCSLGYLGTNPGMPFIDGKNDILHSIVMGTVSHEQMQSHEYSDPDMTLWDIKGYINEKINKILPKYMLPESYLEIDKIPISANGKVDIKALPKYDSKVYDNKKFTFPQNEVEKKVSAIWCEVLNLNKVSINDNFFELGGNSIKVISLRNKLTDEFGVDVDIIDLFNNPTIKLLAEKLNFESNLNVEYDSLENHAESTRRRKKMINRFRDEHEKV